MSGLDLPLVYVAGPYSGENVANTRRAILAAHAILADGCAIPVVPHLSALWDLVCPLPYEAWLEYDLALLARCDALLRIEGESSGADKEIRFADEHGIAVFYRHAALLAWAENWNPTR